MKLKYLLILTVLLFFSCSSGKGNEEPVNYNNSDFDRKYSPPESIPEELIPLMVYVEGGVLDSASLPLRGENDTLFVNQSVDSFSMSAYEVTQRQYRAVMGLVDENEYDKPLYFPAWSVSWYDAVKFCNYLSLQLGYEPVYDIEEDVIWNREADGFRLPTEAEWVFAAIGGNESKGSLYPGSNDIKDVGWFADNSLRYTQYVGLKEPNELGLFDMAGNVSEWCWDLFDEDKKEIEMNGLKVPVATKRVFKGGSIEDSIEFIQSCFSYRGANSQSATYRNLGFRIVRSAP